MATPTRLNIYKAQPIREAVLGFNSGGKLTKEALELMKAAGATIIRCQPAWSNVENATTGVLTLDATTKNFLKFCKELGGLKPMFVAGYGPPWSNPLTLTVKEDVAVGATDIPVTASQATLETMIVHKDFLIKGSTQLTAQKNPGGWAYYGTALRSVNAPAGTIKLGSKTNLELKAGDVLTVNRLRYKLLQSETITDEEPAAYLRYVQFLAESIANEGLEGYINIWNEHIWANDRWDCGYSLFEEPPEMLHIGRNKPQLKAVIAATLPKGVVCQNGATDKSGAGCVKSQVIAITQKQAEENLPDENIHDYGSNPEQSMVHPNYLSGEFNFAYLNPEDDTGNFSLILRSQQRNGLEEVMGIMASECGTTETDDTKQAIYLLRRIISHFGLKIASIIYTFADNNAKFPVVNPTTLAPRPAYTAIKQLMELVNALGGDGGSPSSAPTLVGAPDTPYPLLTTALYGKNGGVTFVYQRTFRTVETIWPEIASPATTIARFDLPEKYAVKEVINVRTGAAVVFERAGRLLTVKGIGDEPIAIVTQ